MNGVGKATFISLKFITFLDEKVNHEKESWRDCEKVFCLRAWWVKKTWCKHQICFMLHNFQMISERVYYKPFNVERTNRIYSFLKILTSDYFEFLIYSLNVALSVATNFKLNLREIRSLNFHCQKSFFNVLWKIKIFITLPSLFYRRNNEDEIFSFFIIMLSESFMNNLSLKGRFWLLRW